MGSKAVDSLNVSHRKSGVLLHPTSFPGPYGIGDLGSSAYKFIDFLAESGQTLWQVLPIGPTGYGDSPYQAFSSFAGQPLLISPDHLKELGLLSDEDIEVKPWDPYLVDYGPVIEYKIDLFKKAFDNFDQGSFDSLDADFKKFNRDQKSWLTDYSLFMAVKDYHGGVMWTQWDKEIAFPTDDVKKKWTKKLAKGVKYYKFLQFLFFKEWFALKDYANSKGISIIGDIPIFVAFDSSDVWGSKELFYLDQEGHPVVVAGVPPDYFSETGQLWGNPLYDWEKHKEEGYKWWINRIHMNLKLVDVLRIDHFRGFEAYWAVPYGETTAINGEWRKGPFKDLFYALEAALGKDLPIIAEDLGVITPEVEDLRDSFHFPGMKILQFAFESIEENGFLPHNYVPHSVCYSGTHDNDTSLGWYQKAAEISKDKVRRYLNTDGNDICWDFIRACFSSVSEMAVVPLQDILSLDSRSRMNTPGIAAGNWQWRYDANSLSSYIMDRLYQVSLLYGRLPFKETEEDSK
ncbi:MAG: 4-alpha-glucanotransferase [Vallitaleaceae bacterium]|nr:4-alpha-glucanotransferase [Vallitaleaceae bacterium]